MGNKHGRNIILKNGGMTLENQKIYKLISQ